MPFMYVRTQTFGSHKDEQNSPPHIYTTQRLVMASNFFFFFFVHSGDMPHVGLPVMKPVNRSCSSAAQPITAGIPSTAFFFFFFFSNSPRWKDVNRLDRDARQPCSVTLSHHFHFAVFFFCLFFFFLLLQQRTLGNKEVTLPYC